ncbi:MAG TPA: histone deacetylase [Streptosporangiaceae bacterium]|nr:histone deacetylase [Streptosporangiaceae bacterium]
MGDLVWYVSYGSNMCADRFRCYLLGGRPPGAARTYPGARDNTPPRADKAVWLPGGVYFATESPVWGGGRAFYGPDLPGRAAARAYLITAEQFSDVSAQEMYLQPGTDLDLTRLAAVGRLQMGPGRYETLISVGLDGAAPMVTFTAPWNAGDVPLVSPSAVYLRMLGQGLCEAHGWDAPKVAGYLADLPGARASWTPERIASQCLGD